MKRFAMIVVVLALMAAGTSLTTVDARQKRYTISVRVAMSEGKTGPLLADTPISIRVRDRLRRNHQHYRICFSPAPEDDSACQGLRMGRFAALVSFAPGRVKIRARVTETGSVLTRRIRVLPRE